MATNSPSHNPPSDRSDAQPDESQIDPVGDSSHKTPLTRNALLYWVGSGTWLAFSAASSLTYPFVTDIGQTTFLGIFQALCFALSFFAIGALEHIRHPFKRYTLVRLVACACAGALALAVIGTALDITIVMYGATLLLAFGRAGGFCQWLRLLQTFDINTAKWTLLMGSVVEIALTFSLIPIESQEIRSLVVFGLYAPLGLVMLAANVHINGLPDSEFALRFSYRAAVDESGSVRRIRHELLLPVLCAVALTLVTPIASTIFGGAPRGDTPNEVIVPLSHGLSLLVLGGFWFGLKRDITLPQLYCVFLPLFASIIFLFSLAGGSFGTAVLFIGNSGYFFVSLLMVVTCLVLAKQHGTRVLPLYGAFAGCVYLTDASQLALERLAMNGAIDIEPIVAALLLLYVLMIPVFFIVTPALGRKWPSDKAASNGGTPIQPDPQSPIGASDPIARIAAAHNLSPRQAEVMRYLVSGRDADRIAETLSLTPNTVRSYRKQLYAALGIHGRQELIDLVENEVSRTAGGNG